MKRRGIGRHSDYTDEIAETICARMAVGESIRGICRDEAMPHVSTVMRWLGQNQAFRELYSRARELQAEYLLDEMVEIADDGTNDYVAKRDAEGEIIGWRENGEFVQRSRLRVDARKWAIAKLAPRKYGDKVTLNGDPDNPVRLDVTVTDDQRAAALIAFLAKTKRD